MKEYEMILRSENDIDVDKFRGALECVGLRYTSLKRTHIKAPIVPTNKKGCCGQNDKKSPSMMKKIKNYTETMTRWIAAGRPIVAMKVYANRLLICSDCDSLIKDTECSKCGCPMEFKAKMDLKGLCELNKWQAGG